MKLLETAFSYVQRALQSLGTPELLDQPPAALPSSHAGPDAEAGSGAVAVTLLAPREAVVIDDDCGPRASGQATFEPDLSFGLGEQDEFSDLLSGIGAQASPPEEVSALDLKQREIAELQHNLEMLRPIGDELARVEQLRIAERAEFEAQLEALRKAPAASAPHTAPVSPAGLRDVTRLISALDTTLTGALVGADAAESGAVEPHPHQEAPGQEAPRSSSAKLEARLERTREQLASARQRLQEQKAKTAARRTEAQELRGKLRELEKAQRALQAERKKLLAPVRELVRRAKKPTKPLMRLVELLGIETE